MERALGSPILLGSIRKVPVRMETAPSSRSKLGVLPIAVASLPLLAAVRGVVPTWEFLLVFGLVFVTGLVGGFGRGVPWTKVSRSYLCLVASWAVLSLALLLVRPPISAGTGAEQFSVGVRWVIQIMIGFAFGLLLLVSAASKWGLDWMRRGWVISYLATGCVAIWEVKTGHHLSTGFIVANGLATSSKGTVVSTFFNPNDYATFIAVAFPFLVWSAWRAARLVRLAYVLVCASAVLAVVFEGSAIILLAMGVELTLVVVALVRNRLRRRRVSVWTPVVLLLAVATGGNIFSSASNLNANVRTLSTGRFGSVSSAEARVNLLRNGLFFTWQGFGLGYGPGQFESLMLYDRPPYPTTTNGVHIINAHNVFAEVLVNLGILGLAALVFFLWRVWRASRVQTLPALAARMGLAGFLLAQGASSSFVRTPVFGMFLGSMLVLGVASELGTRPQIAPDDGRSTALSAPLHSFSAQPGARPSGSTARV
jgi:O-antigen ligase